MLVSTPPLISQSQIPQPPFIDLPLTLLIPNCDATFAYPSSPSTTAPSITPIKSRESTSCHGVLHSAHLTSPPPRFCVRAHIRKHSAWKFCPHAARHHTTFAEASSSSSSEKQMGQSPSTFLRVRRSTSSGAIMGGAPAKIVRSSLLSRASW